MFEDLIRESEEYGIDVSNFIKNMFEKMKERKASGDYTLMQEVQLRAARFQKGNIERAKKSKNIAGGTYGNIEVEEEVEEVEVGAVPTQNPRARVIDDKLVFNDPALGWVPNVGGLQEGFTYQIELRETDGQKVVTSARVASESDQDVFDVTTEGLDIVLPNMFDNTRTGVRYPAIDPTFYVENHVDMFFSAIFASSEFQPQNVLLSGPQGTGKTSVIQQMAAKHNRGFFQMSCGMIESPAEWFGFRDVRGDELVYEISAFINACETPNTVILLDEFNRLHTSLQNGLYNILDHNGSAWLDFVKRYVRVANGVVFVATANIGASHTGTFQIDAAMEDRFSYHLRMDYLPEADEIRVLQQKTGIGKIIATKFVKVAKKIREDAKSDESVISKPVSFRQLEAACRLIVNGMKPSQAVEYTLIPKFSDEGGSASEQAEVLKIFQGFFGGSA